MVFKLARERGVPLDEQFQAWNTSKTWRYLSDLDRAVQNTYLIDPTMDYGMSLVAAYNAGVPPSLSTAVYAQFIARRQEQDGGWQATDARPPQSYSRVTSTAIGVRALQLDMPERLEAEKRERLRRAKEWLLSARPADTEERTFQLLGALWAGADEAVRKELANSLLAQQRPDGGWAELPKLESDAYSTGQALVALHETGTVPVSHAAWQRGLRFLLKTQQPDGSWLVKTRLHEPVLVNPPFFESGLPHGEHQIISLMGTTWATAALLLTLDPIPTPKPATIDRAAVTATGKPWMETALFGTAAELKGLLDQGLDADSKTEEGTTLMMMAAPDPEKVRLLIGRGAAVNARSKTNITALMVAANYRGAAESLRLLLQKGADVNAPKDKDPKFHVSALSFALLADDPENVDVLLAKGADVRRRMSFLGMFPARPLDIAVGSKDPRLVRKLVQKGVAINEPDYQDVSLLSRAVMVNDVATVRAMIDLGAKVNEVDKLGMTPLLHAVSIDFGDTQMVELLLKSGADRNARTKEGLSAAQLAGKYNHVEIARALEQPRKAD